MAIDLQQQAVTWNNVDFSLMRFCGIKPGAISKRMPKLYDELENHNLEISAISPSVQ